ncbi:PEPxxWA-CTERM sorting domain-containing protein [Phenylobacterium sp.]|uniref:PEPxxWA-CTERM sorting domain-containing protein n=1 Tax=Phenylobacterium sp. TaxID=1871053 RepID=UPI00286A7A20|nr:PEPxxWA-CTERM sorting domain-containing protein [Phenylobacterium sp.]
MRYAKLAGLSVALLFSTVSGLAHAQVVKPSYLEFESRDQSFDAPLGGLSAGPTVIYGGGGSVASVVKSFEGISQYDVASFGRNFIPPDTIGAVGKTQYMELVNGGMAVFDKATGARTMIQSDVAFWSAAGKTGTNGDQRVMYNAAADKWIALSFGASLGDIQIAVSDTGNAAGTWKSTQFTGFSGLNAVADYPTLAMDKNAVYIGTNNFGGPTQSFKGTTLNVIPIGDLFGALGPSAAAVKQFNTPYTGGSGDDYTRGYAIQGVNSSTAGPNGKIITVSLIDSALQRYDVLNAGTAGATLTATGANIGASYGANSLARQPYTTGTGPTRVVDTLDDRISASAYEVNGKIYSVHTVTETGSGRTSVRVDVINSTTNAIIDEFDIGAPGYDYYQGSIAVNSLGQVVVGFDRSGTSLVDGKITVMARTFNTSGLGHLYQTGSDLVLRVSDTDSYHNGSAFGSPAAGRQRWGDYSAVSLDPMDSSKFWLIGEFAREFNAPAFGHPGGSGFSRWGTYIAEIGMSPVGVPEPSTWAMTILGLGLVGSAMRRRRAIAQA